jgi:hypothetical protein
MQKADYGVLDEWRLEAGRAIHELIRSSNATKSTPGKAKK